MPGGGINALPGLRHRKTYVTHTYTPSREKRDAIFLWVLFGWLAFALLPSWSPDYGLLESTSDEILAAYGWSQLNISWLWYLLPSLLLIRPWQEARREQRSRHYLDAGWAFLCMAFIVVSATVEGRGLGYATIVLFVALGPS